MVTVVSVVYCFGCLCLAANRRLVPRRFFDEKVLLHSAHSNVVGDSAVMSMNGELLMVLVLEMLLLLLSVLLSVLLLMMLLCTLVLRICMASPEFFLKHPAHPGIGQAKGFGDGGGLSGWMLVDVG